MDVAEHGSAPVDLAADLVNAFTPGWRRGAAFAVPDDAARADVLAGVLANRPNRARAWQDAGADELAAAVDLAGRLREVFVAADAVDVDRVAGVVNGLLQRGAVSPVLSAHDGAGWHLHAHPDDAPPAAALSATCALGLAEHVAASGVDRLGSCAADGCDRVFHDVSRNGSRRYCSQACQGRVKTAAFRARRART